MEDLVEPIRLESQKLPAGGSNSTENEKRPAPKAGGCRIEGYVRVKKVGFQLLRTLEAELRNQIITLNVKEELFSFFFFFNIY